ncbi:MAG TPA: outer membrane lipoprotein LolB [Burkholderiales bacterium]|nr:outer membrane lipoprotein LolB [Burkholderiales bacterium]
MKRLVWAAVLLIVAACAQRELKAPEQVEFDLLGRIAARYGSEAFTGNVQWRHAGNGDEMLITTPLGQGVARIVREGDAVHLTTAEGKEFRAPDSESLTERVLGFRLPLEGLADWVQGRPSPALEARGWKIEYQGRDDRGRPTLMRLNYQGIELRFAISQWR